MKTRHSVSLVLALFLVACSSIPIPSATPTATPTRPKPTSTYTPTNTPTPTETPTPVPTPTLLGGGSQYLVTSDCNGVYVNSGTMTETLINITKVEEQLKKDFGCLNITFSPTYQSALIMLPDYKGNVYLYLLSSDGQLKDLGMNSFGGWSPDGSRILLIKWLSDKLRKMYVVSDNGERKIEIGKITPYDGVPSWSFDGSQLYWTKYGKLRMIDPVTGKSKPLPDIDWLPDFLNSHLFFMGSNPYSSFSISPNGNLIAFGNDNQLYVTTPDFTEPRIFTLENQFGEYEHEYISYLQWSPNNDSIVIAVQKNCSWGNCGYERDHYYLVNLEAGLEPIPTDMIPDDTTGLSFYSCGYSPDGRNLVFHVPGTYFLLNIETKQITGTPGDSSSCPDWIEQEEYDQLKELFQSWKP